MLRHLSPQLAATSRTACRSKTGMRLFCDHAPTLEILDVLLGAFLPQCISVLNEDAAIDYLLQEQYAYQISEEQDLRLRLTLWEPRQDKYWFCLAAGPLFRPDHQVFHPLCNVLLFSAFLRIPIHSLRSTETRKSLFRTHLHDHNLLLFSDLIVVTLGHSLFAKHFGHQRTGRTETNDG